MPGVLVLLANTTTVSTRVQLSGEYERQLRKLG